MPNGSDEVVKITDENILKYMPDGKWVKISYIIKALNVKEITDARFLEVRLKELLNQNQIERESQDGKSYYRKNPQKKKSPTISIATAQGENEPRLQDLLVSEQKYALNKLSKNILPILKAHKQDFKRKSTKDLERMLEMLGMEKNRFNEYQPTDKMLRNFIDETISLINVVKEEQFNIMEQEYITKVLPTIVKKNEKEINKITSQIGAYFSESEAAKTIVEKVIKNKSPVPQSYLISVILKRIQDKSL